MEVGLIGLCLLVVVTGLTGINEEHQIGHAFEESPAICFPALHIFRRGWHDP